MTPGHQHRLLLRVQQPSSIITPDANGRCFVRSTFASSSRSLLHRHAASGEACISPEVGGIEGVRIPLLLQDRGRWRKDILREHQGASPGSLWSFCTVSAQLYSKEHYLPQVIDSAARGSQEERPY